MLVISFKVNLAVMFGFLLMNKVSSEWKDQKGMHSSAFNVGRNASFPHYGSTGDCDLMSDPELTFTFADQQLICHSQSEVRRISAPSWAHARDIRVVMLWLKKFEQDLLWDHMDVDDEKL
jgi:hypothetical protein